MFYRPEQANRKHRCLEVTLGIFVALAVSAAVAQSIVSMIVTMGVSDGMARFYYEKKNQEKQYSSP